MIKTFEAVHLLQTNHCKISNYQNFKRGVDKILLMTFYDGGERKSLKITKNDCHIPCVQLKREDMNCKNVDVKTFHT